ncbi:MAG: helix-turn-helix domain-containing protein [Muribaculaceae bacterium]|nr:helix-turn-helix domain-containing protein [Muribaculaceae bacterium]
MNTAGNSDNILSVLEGFTLDNPDDIMQQVAENFRKRRVEKNITRQRIAELSGVPLSSVARFEQKGLIAFESLIKLAMALGYTSEIRALFSAPKFDTMEELDLIRQKRNDKRAYPKRSRVCRLAMAMAATAASEPLLPR